jgi:hypothetical protein
LQALQINESMNPTKTNQPRLPKGRVMYSHCSSGIIDVYDSSMGAQTSRNRFGYGDIVPCAVLPCRTAREAKAIVSFMRAIEDGATDFTARTDNGQLVRFMRLANLRAVEGKT